MSIPVPLQILADGPAGRRSRQARLARFLIADPNVVPAVPPVVGELFQPPNPLPIVQPSAPQDPKLLYIRFDWNQFAFRPETAQAQTPAQQDESLPFQLVQFLGLLDNAPNLNWHFVNGTRAVRLMLNKAGQLFAQLRNPLVDLQISALQMVRTYNRIVSAAGQFVAPNQPLLLKSNVSNSRIPTPGILFSGTGQLAEFMASPAIRARYFPTWDGVYLEQVSPVDSLQGYSPQQAANVPSNRRTMFQAVFVGYPNAFLTKPADEGLDGGFLYLQVFDTAVRPYFCEACTLLRYADSRLSDECLAELSRSACPERLFAELDDGPLAGCDPAVAPAGAPVQVFGGTCWPATPAGVLGGPRPPTGFQARTQQGPFFANGFPGPFQPNTFNGVGCPTPFPGTGPPANLAGLPCEDECGCEEDGEDCCCHDCCCEDDLDLMGTLNDPGCRRRRPRAPCHPNRGACPTGLQSSGACLFAECGGGGAAEEEVQLANDWRSGFWKVVAPGSITASTLLGVPLVDWTAWLATVNQFRLDNRLDSCTFEFGVGLVGGLPTLQVTDVRLGFVYNQLAESSAGLPPNFSRDFLIQYVRQRFDAINP